MSTSSTSNVDHDEIAHFAALASQWWDEQGDFKTLHQINPLRLEYIENACQGLFDKKVLDVGCGGGILSESMAKRGAKVTAIDMGLEQIQVAKLHALESQVELTYLQSTAEDHASEQANRYDVVTCMEMLEHVPDPASVIQACARLVKPGGTLVMSTINRTNKAYVLMIVAAEKLLKLVPNGTHQHSKFIRPAELINWAEQQALLCHDLKGVSVIPFIEQYKLSHNVDVNYMVHFSKPQ